MVINTLTTKLGWPCFLPFIQISSNSPCQVDWYFLIAEFEGYFFVLFSPFNAPYCHGVSLNGPLWVGNINSISLKKYFFLKIKVVLYLLKEITQTAEMQLYWIVRKHYCLHPSAGRHFLFKSEKGCVSGGILSWSSQFWKKPAIWCFPAPQSHYETFSKVCVDKMDSDNADASYYRTQTKKSGLLKPPVSHASLSLCAQTRQE